MDKDENQMALQEIKSLANKLKFQIEQFEDEVFASCFDIGEVDISFEEVEGLASKVRDQINLMQQSPLEEDEE
ncbi:MAG: hypothetical protein WA933_21705 [Microcoleaceae cyanobacterium]